MAAVEIVSQGTVTSVTNTIDFASIPQTYKHLSLTLNGKSTYTSSPRDIVIGYMNGTSSSGDYARGEIYGDSFSGSTNNLIKNTFTASKMWTLGQIPSSQSGFYAGVNATIEIWIPGYSNTTFTKTLLSRCVIPSNYNFSNGGTAGPWQNMSVYGRNVTAALTRLYIQTLDGNMQSGFQYQMLGYK
eukprot:COSAG02_NODE_5466_length_4299_cov_5.037857_7_plen_186_part_00